MTVVLLASCDRSKAKQSDGVNSELNAGADSTAMVKEAPKPGSEDQATLDSIKAAKMEKKRKGGN